MVCIDYSSYNHILMKLFPRSLQGDALKWFYRLPAHSIFSFQQLVDEFISYFDVACLFESRMKSLLLLKQGHDEINRDFVR